MKAAYVISGLVFQMEFDINVEGSQVQVMVISIISLMRKKMVYSWMKCLKCFIPQIRRHLLDIGWIGLQYLGTQYPDLWSFTIFLTKNWVPKSMLAFPAFPAFPTEPKHEYVISVHVFPTYIFIADWLKNQVKECTYFLP